MTDYWLSKLFYDLQAPGAAAEYNADRAKVLDRYPLKPEARRAVEADDVPALAKLVNAYLLRFYFFAIGMKDEQFIARLRASAQPAEAHHG